jgi:sulfatase-like protein
MRSAVVLIILCAALLPAQNHNTQNVILVTADGLRWQDVFRGADQNLLSFDDAGMKDAAEVKTRFDAATPSERRQRLMPFLWSTIAADGVIYGNRDLSSNVVTKNRHRFSYPGYSEILTGRPQDDVIDSNDNVPNPSSTVLEIARRELGLRAEHAALFGSWNVFTGIGAHVPGSVFINAGFHALELPGASERLRELSRMQFDLLTPWRTVRHDYITYELALEYLRTVQPRVLHIALGETDDWAHNDRFDRYLESAHYFDQCLRRLWEFIESDPYYRGRTTLIVTTDHGRGATRKDWDGHGDDVKGAEQIWIAAIGPDTRAAGEASNAPTYTQSDIAPTILDLLDIDYRKLEATEGKPIPAITGK